MNPLLVIGIIVFSFWYLDRALANWKKEQDEKLNDIKGTVDDLYREFQEKFGESDMED
jgi:hypothetical protein